MKITNSQVFAFWVETKQSKSQFDNQKIQIFGLRQNKQESSRKIQQSKISRSRKFNNSNFRVCEFSRFWVETRHSKTQFENGRKFEFSSFRLFGTKQSKSQLENSKNSRIHTFWVETTQSKSQLENSKNLTFRKFEN